MLRKTIALSLLFILVVGMGTSIVEAQPVAPHWVFGDVTYEDGTPAASVNIYFKDDAGNVVAFDVTNGNGFYDTNALPGEDNNIPEPEDKTLDIYVGDWDSGKNLQWQSAKSERIDISGVPVPAAALVSTDSATNVTVNSATLNASIDYGGYASVYITFFYREVGGSWENTELDTITAASYSKEITGLKKETGYEFYAYIKFDGLEDTGATKSFTTTAIVPPEKATLKVDTTPVKGEVFVDGSSWGTAPQTRSVDPGSYTVSFGDVSGYITPPAQTVTLAVGETKTVIGTYEAVVPDFSMSVGPTSGSVVQGGSVTATVSITSIAGFDETVGLLASGLLSGATASFSPSSGTPSFDSTLTISAASTTPIGTYSVTITGTGGGKTHSCTYSLTVTTLAEFEVSDLSISPKEVKPGETVTVSAKVTNVGEQEGSYEVKFKVGGVLEDTESVTLSPDGSTTVTFTTSKEEEGNYAVEVDGLTGSFDVKKPAVFPWSVVVAVIIVIVVVWICYWKREEISRGLRKVLKKK